MVLEVILKLLENKHPQEIATYLMDQVLNENNLDDISIIVIKVIENEVE